MLISPSLGNVGARFKRYGELVTAAQLQSGEAIHCGSRCLADSQLDPDQPLAEHVNLLRAVDNQRCPILQSDYDLEPLADKDELADFISLHFVLILN